MNIMSTSIAGIQRGMDAFQTAASNIANSGQADDTKDLTQNLVSLQQSKVQVEANVKVLDTSSSTIGSLLDIQA